MENKIYRILGFCSYYWQSIASPRFRNQVYHASGDATLGKYAFVSWNHQEGGEKGQVVVGECKEYNLALLEMISHSMIEEDALVDSLQLYQKFCTDSESKKGASKHASSTSHAHAYGESNRLSDASEPTAHTIAPEKEFGNGLREKERFIIAIEEFVALVAGLLVFCEIMKGGVLIYAMDNKLVERWLETRTSNHPVAAHLLMIIAAIEADYQIKVFAGNVRTFHSIVASDFTRLELAKCLAQYGMSLVPAPDWAQWLQLGWVTCALI